MYVHICIHIHMLYICICRYKYVYTYIYIYHIYKCIYTYIHTYVYIYIYIYIYLFINIHTYIHTYIHAYKNTYKQTYRHTLRQDLPFIYSSLSSSFILCVRWEGSKGLGMLRLEIAHNRFLNHLQTHEGRSLLSGNRNRRCGIMLACRRTAVLRSGASPSHATFRKAPACSTLLCMLQMCSKSQPALARHLDKARSLEMHHL